MTLRIRNLQVDVPAELHDDAVAWWAAALGGTPRLHEPLYTHLDGVRARVGVHLQRLDERAETGRYHLDLEADDPAVEAARLEGLGAVVVGTADDWEEDAIVFADPAGLLFCVTDLGQEQHLSDERGDEVHLRVLMFDVPSDKATVQSEFWAAALGGEAKPVGEKYPEYTWVHGVEGPGGPINIAVQALHDGDARLHVDLHLPNPTARDADVARLTGLGAEQVDASHHWRVLRAPGGHLACVVPDAPD